MRILLANKFYYPRGGDCIYTQSLEALLKQEGHSVAIFSMQHPSTSENVWAQYFPSEVSYTTRNPFELARAMIRPIYSREVSRKFTSLLDQFNPDVVHLNNVHSQLSPLIAEIAKKRNIRVVWTLHDYKLLCPRYDCIRNGRSCEKCFNGNKFNVFVHRCIKNSFLASFVAWIEAIKWNKCRLEACVDAFICPSAFMKQKMIKGGFAANKLHIQHNFIDPKRVDFRTDEVKDHYCYVGRITEEKGIRTLLRAASTLPYTLKVFGSGPIEQELRAEFSEFSQIEFHGHQDWNAIRGELGSAFCSVIPSEWYENCPLSVIESIALGTPVVGARIGGITELLTNECETFTSGNSDELQNAIRRLHARRTKIAHNLNLLHSSKDYLERMLLIYQVPELL